PAWLTHGFEVAGGILPAVGFGLLLRGMFKAQYIPYLNAGFLFVCYTQVSNLLPVAVLGTGFAVYEFFNAKYRQPDQKQPVDRKKRSKNIKKKEEKKKKKK
ncbi:PTS sugar transporter subunit IIC, partial [Escherichia coli]|uniref:PTS sugar transporter subunit IIC n=1 Tax=Escherichia coli TaxID=562 RepID=UPI0035D72141